MFEAVDKRRQQFRHAEYAIIALVDDVAAIDAIHRDSISARQMDESMKEADFSARSERQVRRTLAVTIFPFLKRDPPPPYVREHVTFREALMMETVNVSRL